jgi:ABC-type multidrug transport system ATPase subunit
LHKPKLLLLDRPFDEINQETSQLIANILKDFAQKQGIVIFTTNSLESQPVGLASRAVSIKETI